MSSHALGSGTRLPGVSGSGPPGCLVRQHPIRNACPAAPGQWRPCGTSRPTVPGRRQTAWPSPARPRWPCPCRQTTPPPTRAAMAQASISSSS